MLRDLNFLRRNSGKNTQLDEPENVPPVNTIQEPVRNPSKIDPELGFKTTKINRTPTKVTGSKHSEAGMPMRTPEKQGGLAKNRYGWGSESRNEVKNGSMNMNTPRSCRTVRAINSGYSEGNSTQNTPTKSVNKPPNPGFSHGVSSRPPIGATVRNNGNISALSRGLQNNHTTVNTVEVPHFDLKEDPSFWMDHNVQVLIRIRPLNNMELNTQGYNRCLKQESAQCLTFVGHPESRFTFDHVACETIDQETLFRMAGLPMVENCLSGYNSCIFAYGQTGSGKTHTMLGEINELEVKPSPYRGMTPRMFEFLFARIIAEEESRMDERLTYNCKCSFLEIYNEQITDLLDPSSTNLQLREDVIKGVYVENLTEFEVHTVGDILRLLSQGSANRRVAATNMNRESSRSHSVFTCVIESRWEEDSTSNLRFARLNLVDLAGSERQKTSGAEGERLKEAANINKSLSTLGHVIMALVDGTRHIPYRDSRLTFLLQDSLGGNSKTMIIANISPSVCSATETLNTLKFAQRAKLIQNNAVVNEDASGDVMALRYQIQLLKEEVAALKRQNVSRSLTFGPKVTEEARQEHGNDYDNISGQDNKILRVSSKQLKSLETSLTGAMRREQMSETSIQQLEAEIEHLNRLVRQREEDNKCTKMMLKFREDKISRMESVVAGLIPADSYLLEENNMLNEEIQMLRAKTDRNPEVTRFALENIRLLEQLRRFQDFYEEGERDMLLSEVSELRNQLVLFLDENSKKDDHMQKEPAHDNEEENPLQLELERSHEELEKCRNNLNSCLEKNEKLCKEIADLNALLENQKSADGGIEVIKELILEASSVNVNPPEEVMDMQLEESNTVLNKNETSANYVEEVINLQLKVDILETILKEKSLSRMEIEEKNLYLSRDLKITEEKYLLITKEYKDLKEELEEAKSVIDALETEQLISINELEDLRSENNRYVKELQEKELKISSLNDKIQPLLLNEQQKLNKMKDSLEKARKTNNFYKTEREFNANNEEEMDEVRKQVEAETAEVIVCLQEEIASLQEELHESSMEGKKVKQELTVLRENYEEKEKYLNILSNEIEEVLTTGLEALEDVSYDVTTCEKLQMITKSIFEKELRIKELNSCLEDVKNQGVEMEGMLMSLKGATLVMSEAHQRDCNEKDQVITKLLSQLKEKNCEISHLNNEINKMSVCATSAFVIVNRLNEMKNDRLEMLTQKDAELDELKKNHKSCRSSRDVSRRDDTIILLKKELETALLSLNGVKTEIARLHSEKETVRLSEKQSRKSIELLVPQVMELQSVADNFEKQIGVAMVSLDHKIQTVEQLLQESCKFCYQKRKLYELELMDSKVNAAQQSAESSCVYAKFAEAQYTIKEADVMINELLIANETMKLEIENLKKKEIILLNEKDMLLQRFETDTMGMKHEIEELEGMILQIQSTVDEDLIPTVSDFFCMKSKIHDSSKLIQLWIEEIWSEIIEKDFVVSVLRVCHMGILLQTVNGFNAENGLLNHDLCESNSLVSQLKEQNCKSRNELEMCRKIQEKLLVDIKNNFDRVLKGTEETGVLSVKLVNFEKKMQSLQLQEEIMVERSNNMGNELSVLVKELEKMDKNEEIRFLEEQFMADLFAKEIEVVILSSELKEKDSQRKDLEKENKNMCMVFDKFKEQESQSLEKSQMLEISVCKLQDECVNLINIMDIKNRGMFDLLSDKCVSLEQRFEDINGSNEKTKMFMEEFDCLEKLTNNVISENLNLQNELKQKDKILEGLLFDLQLLQESSSKNKDQNDEIEELTASLESSEHELHKNIVKNQVLESQLKEKVAIIAILESDVSREGELVKTLFSEIEMLTESVKDAVKTKEMTELELVQLESDLVELRKLVEMKTSELDKVSCKNEDLYNEVIEVKKQLEMAHALAEENEAIATEAKQMAETSRVYAEEKEEEVKLYEKSVEELEFIVNALESQVDMVKGEAERQRLQREELELEFQAFKQQIHTVQSSDSDTKRLLNEKEKYLQEILQRVQLLEKEIASKDSEIFQHKVHINELNLHAEAQAREYKQTFKTLEAMADQVKTDNSACGQQISNSPSKKLEKVPSRSRGSGSPFKCIGLGLAQQLKSERDNELLAAKQRIEELELLAANLQKEIFALNAKLAMSGSMTHDVLRDLLGIKLDMTSYSSLVDGHQIEEITEKARVHNPEIQLQEEDVIKMKQQLNELVIERKGWLEEIERKQGEMIAAQVALEQLRQKNRLLTTENEMFKTEIANHKIKAIDLEAQVTKLSGQQNLQQRIHHHTKIKEENNALKTKNEELSRKLRRTDAILSRVKEEIAILRANNENNTYYVETELQLDEKLKETENERDQLAHKLAALCTSILKVAGVREPTSDVTLSMAEEALEQLQDHVAKLEREIQDLQYKNRISNERIRLSEIMPQMSDESRQTSSRSSARSPFLSSLDR